MSSIKYKIWMLLPLMAMISCESILDKFPEDKITPETFFTTENELELYSNNFYVACISGTGVFKDYGDVIIQPILEKAISGQRTILKQILISMVGVGEPFVILISAWRTFIVARMRKYGIIMKVWHVFLELIFIL